MGIQIPRGHSRRPRSAGGAVADAVGPDLAGARVGVRARLHAPDHRRRRDARPARLPVDPAPAGAARRRPRPPGGRGAHGHDPLPPPRHQVQGHHHADPARGARGLLRGPRDGRPEAGLCRHHRRRQEVRPRRRHPRGPGRVCQPEACIVRFGASRLARRPIGGGMGKAEKGPVSREQHGLK